MLGLWQPISAEADRRQVLRLGGPRAEGQADREEVRAPHVHPSCLNEVIVIMGMAGCNRGGAPARKLQASCRKPFDATS